MTGILRIGFFENFKGRDAILMSGDAAALASLIGITRSLASGSIVRSQLDQTSFVRAYHGVSLLLERGAMSSGLQYVSRDAHWRSSEPKLPQTQPAFLWRLSPEDWDDVAERIGNLEGHAGHHYPADSLGTVDDVGIVVSHGEYADSWRGWQ
jgi:hypothetical protein